MIGRKLIIPLGDGTVSVTVDKQGVIRFSLGTRDLLEAKARQADVLAYLERLFVSERDNRPVKLSRQQAVALAGKLYRAWRPKSMMFLPPYSPDWRQRCPARRPPPTAHR